MTQIYLRANRALIAKAIEELYYEEVLPVQSLGDGKFYLECSDLNCYQFSAKIASWDSLWIEEESLRKFKNEKEINLFARDFFIETQEFTQMSDETLATFLEEMNQTLYSDCVMLEKNSLISKNEVLEMNFIELNSVLNGHPKLILNKGRLGWGALELESYSPENAESFKLIWLAGLREKMTIGEFHNQDEEFLIQVLTKNEISTIKAKLGNDYSKYYIFPVHPWQWNRYIKIQYALEIASNDLKYLGNLGEFYTPQTSIRTLSNLDSPRKLDVKLSLSILNTSSVRGISSKTIGVGHIISSLVRNIIENDQLLKDKNLLSLSEVCAINMELTNLDKIENLQYRYKELLGCIWRESVDSKLEDGEVAFPVAALFHKHNGEYIIGDIVTKSGDSPSLWLRNYFNLVVIPLYHLQLKYGIGLVAHGQNTIVKMKDFKITSLIIKDFHGDFRLSSDSVLVNHDISSFVEIMPSEYLIHDLVTGHFVTVLRYLSRAFCESFDFSDEDFFGLLGDVVRDYAEQIRPQFEIDPGVSILREKIEKILVNKVRFVAGYNDTRVRLKPILGRNILNPLRRGLYEQ